VIIPGESKVLQVTTDAVQPTFQWFRNNVLLAGANSSAYTATLNGTYKVIVTQTQGCNSTQEAVVDLIYPDSFTVVIAPSSNYADCANSATQLRITSFNATTSLGTVSILNNDYGYTYQWYRNNNLVVSSNQNTLDITSLTENGSYELRVVVPNFNLIISNIVVIKLGLDIQVTVVADAEFICENGGSTLLTSNANQANYQYNWFRSGTTQSIGSQSELTVTSAGTYYLVVTVSDCTYTSNEVNVNAIDESYVTLSEAENFTVFEGSTKMVYATGGDSYQWFFGDDLVAVGPSYGVSEAGSYLLIAMVGNCEIVKIFNVTIIENNSIVIPNFVSINNDGRNDLWAIPEKYTNKEDVEITIYASSGKVIFRSRNYQNNWPTNTFSYSKKDPVVYYTISENNQITKKGTITIIE
jgi:gliding motility-associated-like protein